jgi:4-hydroxybenzoate polyprenyltransferase
VLCFCLVASAAYLTNDVMDRDSDRAHSSKRNRPIAAGSITPQAALVVALALALAGAGVGFAVSLPFLEVVGLYVLTTTVYTLVLKKHVLLDIFGLTSLYVLRLLAGHVACQIPYSPWLTTFCMFVFLGLAALKRATELQQMIGGGVPGRGYRVEDMSWLVPMGVASAFVSTVVLAQYIDTGMSAAGLLYRHAHWLWLTCPITLYWQCRNWVTLVRGEMHDDPVWNAFRDPASYCCAVLCILALFLAS